ncbi:MAG: hypothetical protein ACR2RV_13580 [Verrucomicrobiales bacterium]
MRIPHSIVALALSCSLLATAQDQGEPKTTEATPPLTPEATANREAGIATAKKNALEVAHQIGASRSYRQRDSYWTGALPGEGFVIIPLQLYADNDYYITVGTDTDSQSVSIAAFTPDRMLIKTAPNRGEGKLILHIKPEQSGPHYLRLHLNEKTARPAHCAVTYVYR